MNTTEPSRRVSRDFPTTSKRPINPEELSDLLTKAIDEILNYCRANEPKTFTWSVWRVSDSGLESHDIPIPRYFLGRDLNLSTLITLRWVAAWLQYLWDNGRCRLSLEGPDPQRVSWEKWIVIDEVLGPLSWALTQSAFCQATDTDTITPWHLDNCKRSELVSHLVAMQCKDVERFEVKCPLFWIEQSSFTSFTLGPSVTISAGDRRTIANYLTDSGPRISPDHLSGFLMHDSAILEFTLDIESGIRSEGKELRDGTRKRIEEVAGEAASVTIDMAKWALLTGCEAGAPPLAGPISFRSLKSGNAFNLQVLRPMGTEGMQGTIYRLTAEKIDRVQKNYGAASKYRLISRDFSDGLWYWGRACIATLSRDRLLESCIGLERLLVKSAPQNRYKIGLHGAALLGRTAEAAQIIAKELRKIYDERSSAAHGSPETSSIEYSRKALRRLAETLFAITEDFDTNRLNPEESVAEQLEQVVLARAVRSA